VSAVAGVWSNRLLGASGDRVAVVYHSGGEAYVEAVGGVREVLGRAGTEAVWQDVADNQRRLSGGFRLAIALGTAGWEAIEREALRTAILPALVARAEAEQHSTASRAATVYLDVPVPVVLHELRGVFRGKARAGLIQGRAAAAGEEQQIIVRARQSGFQLAIRVCADPRELVPALLSLRGKADFVLTTPDTRLFNAATVKPLVLASLENRLPLIGFSAGFVRAGAAAGVYPDYRDLGEQTAEAAVRWMNGQGGSEETPRKRVIAVNQRVTRLLGVSWEEGNSGLLVFR
jgi:hypothetical protein